MPNLICKRVLFYSSADEAAFFSFVRSIKAVRRIDGCGDAIILSVSSRASKESLRDLRALFRRYRISDPGQIDSNFGG